MGIFFSFTANGKVEESEHRSERKGVKEETKHKRDRIRGRRGRGETFTRAGRDRRCYRRFYAEKCG